MTNRRGLSIASVVLAACIPAAAQQESTLTLLQSLPAESVGAAMDGAALPGKANPLVSVSPSAVTRSQLSRGRGASSGRRTVLDWSDEKTQGAANMFSGAWIGAIGAGAVLATREGQNGEVPAQVFMTLVYGLAGVGVAGSAVETKSVPKKVALVALAGTFAAVAVGSGKSADVARDAGKVAMAGGGALFVAGARKVIMADANERKER